MPALALPDPPLSDGVVTLRAYEPRHREAVVAAVQDPEIPRWTTVPSPYGPADYDAFLVRERRMRQEGRSLSLLIVDSQERVVGAVGLHEVDSGRPDIGYWAAAHARGRGFTARAVRLLRDHARELGFERVDVLVHPDNEPSQRVARAAGFVATGDRVPCRRSADGTVPTHLRYTWPAGA